MGLTEFLLVVAVGGGIVAVLYATFRGAAEESVGGGGGAATPAAADPELAELDERRRAVERALDEIEADRDAGNLSEADYEEMRSRYAKEVALLGERLSAHRQAVVAEAPAQPATAGASSVAGRSRVPAAVGWVAGIAGFLALAWLVMSTALRPRGADDTITGSLPGQGMGGAGGGAGPAIADVDMDSVRELEALVAGDSSNVEALGELGHMYLTLQRYGEVITLSMKALDLEPDNPEALTHMGMVLVSVDHIEEGMASFDRALESDPDFAEALLFKGMIAFRQQSFATAAEAWEHYLEVAPADANVDRIRGMLEAARQSAGQGGQ